MGTSTPPLDSLYRMEMNFESWRLETMFLNHSLFPDLSEKYEADRLLTLASDCPRCPY